MPVIPLVEVSATQRRALEVAARQARRVRVWRRYQAILLLAAGQEPAAVVAALGCGRASVYAWATAWRADGVGGLAEGPHGGGRPRRGTARWDRWRTCYRRIRRSVDAPAPAGPCRCCAPNWGLVASR